MAIYSGCFNTNIATTGQAAMDFDTGPSNAPKFLEYGIQTGIATASTYGIGRSGNTTSVQLGQTYFIAEDINPIPGQTSAAIAWSIAPTIPAVFLRRITLPSTALGQSCIITFPRGIDITVNTGSLVTWNLATNTASANIWGMTDE